MKYFKIIAKENILDKFIKMNLKDKEKFYNKEIKNPSYKWPFFIERINTAIEKKQPNSLSFLSSDKLVIDSIEKFYKFMIK